MSACASFYYPLMRPLSVMVLLFAAILLSGCSWSGLGLPEDGSDPETFELTLNAGAHGSVSASGSSPYNRNEIVTLTASPDTGYQVASWSGTMDDGVASLGNFVRMNSDKTVSVTFIEAITLSGTATYTSVPATSGGLDYASTTNEPIRGAVVQIVDQASSVIYSEGNLDASGNYSLSAPANTAIRIIVQAALGTPGSPHTAVVDNTDAQSLYAIFMDMTTGAVDSSGNDFNADSGWDIPSTSYTSARNAGPFAILDVIYQAEQMVLAADGSATFPTLLVNWSENNIPVSGDPDIGEIGTSFYEPSSRSLWILGAEDTDTDEYDQAIVAHEWVHYFEDQFSRSDSPGGPHASGDILDPSVALSEGLANAVSGIIRGTNEYIDTAGLDQGSIGLELDLEADSVPDGQTWDDVNGGGDMRLLDGYWSEDSVQEVLYDIMDSNDDDADTLPLGFVGLYNAMTGDYMNTPAFTSMLTLLHYIDVENSGNTAAIDAIASAENIDMGDEFDTDDIATGMHMYTPLTLGTLQSDDVDGNTLTTEETYGSMAGALDNKLNNRRFFSMMSLAAGDYIISVTPVTSGRRPVLFLNDGSIFSITVDDTQMDVPYTHTASGDFSFAAGTVDAAGDFTVEINTAPATVTAPLSIPEGNG